MTDVMIDIETMGTLPSCVVLTIGAVRFDPNDDKVLMEELYMHLDMEQQIHMNRSVDQDTMDWWDKQDKAIREEAFKSEGRLKVEDGLNKLSEFLEGAECVWAHGPQFDMTILEDLYRKVELKTPWRYSRVRDTRTLFAVLGDLRPSDRPAAHNALEDSRYQAVGVQACIDKVNRFPMPMDGWEGWSGWSSWASWATADRETLDRMGWL